MSSGNYQFETLAVTKPKEFVTHVELNRPKKLNAMNTAFWREFRECFQQLATDEECRVVVLSGAGRIFTAGLDFTDMGDVVSLHTSDINVGMKAFQKSRTIKQYQETFTSLEKCPKPVIAAVHNACVGGGVDLTSACDIRYCTKDAFFQIKEVDIGCPADVGTLQRFPKVIGNDSLARELTYTARKMFADEARQVGYVSRIFDTKEVMLEGALDVASVIGSKSPIAVQGSKINIVYSRDHSVREGLEHVAQWNQAMIPSEDVMKAAMDFMGKKQPAFSKL